jgi:hypothetical protein
MTLSIKLVGAEKALRALEEFPKRLRNKHMRIAHNAGGGVIKREVVSQTQSKHLKRNQIVKVKQKRDGNWYTAVGTKRGKTVTIKTKGRIVRAKGKSETRVQEKRFNVSRIAHLLESGTKSHQVNIKNKRTLATPIGGLWTAFGRRVMVRSSGKHSMQKAAALSGAIAVQKTISKLNEGIEKEALALLR